MTRTAARPASGRAVGSVRRRTLAWLATAAASLALFAPAVVQGWGGTPHDAPVLLVGPDVVTGPLVAGAELVEGHLDIGTGITDSDEARTEVAEGRVIGALVLDLRTTEDELLIRDDLHPRVRDALVADVTAVEQRYGRTPTVQEVPGRTPPDRALLWAAGLSVLAGYLLAVAISLIWGRCRAASAGAWSASPPRPGSVHWSRSRPSAHPPCDLPGTSPLRSPRPWCSGCPASARR
ncbi:hypothetical protein [Nocardioides sambongensis]|uniref:hypothetical protein n=1 Tax=Nocardioides sambongensis TaxID=2589074 RepID=UPI00112969ED|nr:hypothetical protein [Nocardioides sambongensis]